MGERDHGVGAATPICGRTETRSLSTLDSRALLCVARRGHRGGRSRRVLGAGRGCDQLFARRAGLAEGVRLPSADIARALSYRKITGENAEKNESGWYAEP